jgi:hypothetical protein
MMDENVADFIYSMIFFLPFILIYLVGLTLSIVFRKRMGSLWICSSIAFLVHMFASVIEVIMQVVFYFYIVPSHGYSSYETISRIFGVITMLLHVIAYVLILIALFANRKQKLSAA